MRRSGRCRTTSRSWFRRPLAGRLLLICGAAAGKGIRVGLGEHHRPVVRGDRGRSHRRPAGHRPPPVGVRRDHEAGQQVLHCKVRNIVQLLSVASGDPSGFHGKCLRLQFSGPEQTFIRDKLDIANRDTGSPIRASRSRTAPEFRSNPGLAAEPPWRTSHPAAKGIHAHNLAWMDSEGGTLQQDSPVSGGAAHGIHEHPADPAVDIVRNRLGTSDKTFAFDDTLQRQGLQGKSKVHRSY